MLTLFHRIQAAIALARAEHAAAADEIAGDNLHRLTWLAAAMIVIGLLHILVFQARGLDDAPRVQAWKHSLLGLYQGMVLFSALLGALALWLRRGGRCGGLASRACGLTAFVVALGFTVLVSAVDQWVTPSITPFLIGCTLVGVVILQKPLISAAIYLLALAVLWVLLGKMQPDPQLLLSNRVNAVSVAVLGWVLTTMTWRKSVQNLLLRRQLERRQQELEAQQLELQHLAAHDGLTRLLNRAELERLCRMELLRAQRHKLPLSVLVIDLDDFKRVNDRWGHPVGDATLVAAADVLRNSVRTSDVVGRMGGEEFMVLLPHSDMAAALTLAEKLRRAMGAMTVWAGAERVVVTSSVGVASAPAGVETSFDSLYLKADRALYRAKAAGRNRVEIA